MSDILQRNLRDKIEMPNSNIKIRNHLHFLNLKYSHNHGYEMPSREEKKNVKCQIKIQM